MAAKRRRGKRKRKGSGEEHGQVELLSEPSRPAPSPSDDEPAASPEGPDEASPAPRAETPRASDAGKQLARAKELVARGRVQEAIDQYLVILADDPGNLKAHNNLGVLYDELKQHDLAIEHFAAAERVDPDNVELLTNYGSSLTSLARWDEAEMALGHAHRLAPEDPAVRLALGVLAFRRGSYLAAETELAWVCGRDPAMGSAFYYRGEALNRLGRFEEALATMERAAELMPDDPRPAYTLGHLYDRAGRRAEAVDMYRHARRLQGC